MQELVVSSGKGGTGKTSVVASFAALADNVVVADCDVDAADLHLVLAPRIVTREEFSGGSKAQIDPARCIGCGECKVTCRFDAVLANGQATGSGQPTYRIDPIACEGCGVCAWVCEQEAIRFLPAPSGQWFVSQTRCCPMVHARLEPGAENSGKLVSVVRSEAKKIAVRQNLELILIDGSPGIGCPVIASITGADAVLVVAEPTCSALHDFRRVADLAMHFNIRTFVTVNKWDLNPEICGQIEREATDRGAGVVGRICYDSSVTEAQIRGLSVVEYTDKGAAWDIRQTWRSLSEALRENEARQQLKVLS
jgi:MinD superfamily P-loop ATPase